MTFPSTDGKTLLAFQCNETFSSDFYNLRQGNIMQELPLNKNFFRQKSDRKRNGLFAYPISLIDMTIKENLVLFLSAGLHSYLFRRICMRESYLVVKLPLPSLVGLLILVLHGYHQSQFANISFFHCCVHGRFDPYIISITHEACIPWGCRKKECGLQ